MSAPAATALDLIGTVTALRARGFALCKPDSGTKCPTAPGWSTRSLEPHDFAPGDLVGILGGPLSDGNQTGHSLVVIDLDDPAAIEKADGLLPETGLIDGRPSKPRSHRGYLVANDTVPTWAYSYAEQGAQAAVDLTGFPGPFKKQFRHQKTHRCVLDFIGTGGQVVCPPSSHPSGEVREWQGGEPGEPATVAFPVLWEAVARLAKACGGQMPSGLSWPWEKPKPHRRPAVRQGGGAAPDMIEKRAAAYLAKCPAAVQGEGGRDVTFTVARYMVYGFDLGVDAGYLLLADQWNPNCTPPWSEKDLRAKCREADQVPFDKPRGWLRDAAKPDNGRGSARTAQADGSKTPAVASTPAAAPTPPARVLITEAEHAVNDQAAAALVADQSLYQRGRDLVRVLSRPETRRQGIDHPAGPEIVPVALPTLREKLAKVVEFRREVRRKNDVFEVPEHPPQWCVQAVQARGEWPGVRPLSAVVDYPFVRADGTVCTTPGYDPDTAVYVAEWGGQLDMPGTPTQADAKTAAGMLLDVVADFPFRQPVHKAVWLAALLTPLARFAFDGPAPLFFIGANTPAAGKGLLADTISLTVAAIRFAVAQYSHDPVELRKCITAAAISGDRLILFDNVSGKFGNEALDAALTSTTWKGRVLGESREVTLPLRATWYATGNNCQLAGDSSRRILPIDLHSDLERPDERDGFRHPDLRGHVRTHRPRLLGAALTILSAYLRAGCPGVKLSPFGSFEEWSRVVRGAVVWAGLPDPAGARADLRDTADGEVMLVKCILQNWHLLGDTGSGITVNLLLKRLFKDDGTQDDETGLADLRDAVDTLSPKRDARALGDKFRKYRKRMLDGLYLDQAGVTNKRLRWTVLDATRGSTGSGGSFSTHPATGNNLFNSGLMRGRNDPPDPVDPPCGGGSRAAAARRLHRHFELHRPRGVEPTTPTTAAECPGGRPQATRLTTSFCPDPSLMTVSPRAPLAPTSATGPPRYRANSSEPGTHKADLGRERPVTHLTSGKAALAVGVLSSNLIALADRGLVPFAWAGKYRIFATADLPAIRAACVKAGYLPDGQAAAADRAVPASVA